MWFVRPVLVIGRSTVPLTVEDLVPDSGKLNRQTLERRRAQGVGKGDYLRLSADQACVVWMQVIQPLILD